MNTFSRRLKDYLALRQRLGFKLRDTSRELHQIVRFVHQQKAAFVTTKLAVRWAKRSPACHPARWATLLGKVRSGKVEGISPSLADEVYQDSEVYYLIVEADGSAGSPFESACRT